MPRSLSDLDYAVAQLQTAVPNNYRGLLETLNQSNLAVESQLDALTKAVGTTVDSQGNPVLSGLAASFASLQSSVSALISRVAALEIAVSGLQTQQNTNTSGDGATALALATAQANILSLDTALASLQAQVTALTPAP